MRLAVILLLLLIRIDCWALTPEVYMRAAAATGIPVELLLAISHVESNFHPHALNVSGRSFFPSSQYEALGLLRRSGDNVDIGLMQVNWSYWGNRFGLSKFELLDPQLNVVVGAKILEHCIRVSGSGWKGVGLYHSPESFRQRAYVEKVWRSYRLVLTKMGT
ncbi:MAG: lytic transglycosylase domain-containing protein [Candidatus Binatia bacterium]